MSFTLPSVAEMSPEQREFYDGFPLNLSRGLVLTKSSAKPYLSFGRSFLDGWLPACVRELTILRVGARTGAQYEVFHHRPIALAVGAAEDTIERVVSGADGVGDESLDALLLFVDQLIDSACRDAAATDAISLHYPDEQIAEIVLLVGHYLMTALFVKTLGIQPEVTTEPKGVAGHDA